MHAHKDSKQFIEWLELTVIRYVLYMSMAGICDVRVSEWVSAPHSTLLPARWYLFELINGSIKFMWIDLWYCWFGILWLGNEHLSKRCRYAKFRPIPMYIDWGNAHYPFFSVEHFQYTTWNGNSLNGKKPAKKLINITKWSTVALHSGGCCFSFYAL